MEQKLRTCVFLISVIFVDGLMCLLYVHPQLPLPEEIHWTPGDSKLHDMSAEEVANQLVVFDWELFSCVHEVCQRTD